MATLALVAAAPAGCTVTAGPPPPNPVVIESSTGTLTVEWTLDGAADPNRCAASNVTLIEITVRSTSGSFVGTYQRACTLFAASIPLEVGTYAATATLLEAPLLPRTTTASIDTFTIVSGTDFEAPIDFPTDSFL